MTPVDRPTEEPVPLPRSDVKVGFACNNRCTFCAQGEKRSGCGAIPAEELVGRIEQARAPELGARGLVLTGGEPTLHRHILAVVSAARRMEYDPIQIQTNGRTLAYAHLVQALLKAGATEFSPSLHGSTAAIHDEQTRAPGSWAQSVEGIRNVVAARATVVTNTVVTRRNTSDLPNIVALLGSLGVRHAQLAFVHPVGTAADRFDEVVPRLADVVEPIRQARERARSFGMRLVTEAVPYCFLRGMEELCVEESIPATTVVDLDGRMADYSGWRVAEGKAHGDPCRECIDRTRCEGPWREYTERFGWSEFETRRS